MSYTSKNNTDSTRNDNTGKQDGAAALIADNRSSTAEQLSLQNLMGNNSLANSHRSVQEAMRNSPLVQQKTIQPVENSQGEAPIQAVLWTNAEFTTATTFEKTFSTEPRERKSIAAVDNALQAVHANLIPANRRGLLETLIQRIDVYLEPKVLGEKHTFPTTWRGMKDSGNERINPMLTLKQQVLEELRGGRNVVNGVNWDLHDEMVQETTDLARLKMLVAQRFGLSVAEIGAVPVGGFQVGGTGQVAAAHDWTVPGLKRAYLALKSLPLSHTEANASFGRLLRYEGGGGYFTGHNATVAIGSTDSRLNSNISDDTSVGLPGANSFDWTVRHEVGHAVADKVGAVDGYCATPNGGEWINYGHHQEVDMMREIFRLSNSVMHNILGDGVAVGAILYQAVSVEKGEATKDDAVQAIFRYVPSLPTQSHVTLQQISADPGWNIITSNLESVWEGGARQVIGGRGFVKSSERGYASFADAAFARKVSAYQFRSPHEWFAEAYAAYHDPRAVPGTYLANDPATRGHIAGVV